jgi:excisionase family DNA binding protein
MPEVSTVRPVHRSVQDLLEQILIEPTVTKPVKPSVRDLLERPALSPAEAARVMGCSRMTIYNLVQRGELTATKIGSLARIPTRQLFELLGVDDDAS